MSNSSQSLSSTYLRRAADAHQRVQSALKRDIKWRTIHPNPKALENFGENPGPQAYVAQHLGELHELTSQPDSTLVLDDKKVERAELLASKIENIVRDDLERGAIKERIERIKKIDTDIRNNVRENPNIRDKWSVGNAGFEVKIHKELDKLNKLAQVENPSQLDLSTAENSKLRINFLIKRRTAELEEANRVKAAEAARVEKEAKMLPVAELKKSITELIADLDNKVTELDLYSAVPVINTKAEQPGPKLGHYRAMINNALRELELSKEEKVDRLILDLANETHQKAIEIIEQGKEIKKQTEPVLDKADSEIIEATLVTPASEVDGYYEEVRNELVKGPTEWAALRSGLALGESEKRSTRGFVGDSLTQLLRLKTKVEKSTDDADIQRLLDQAKMGRDDALGSIKDYSNEEVNEIHKRESAYAEKHLGSFENAESYLDDPVKKRVAAALDKLKGLADQADSQELDLANLKQAQEFSAEIKETIELKQKSDRLSNIANDAIASAHSEWNDLKTDLAGREAQIYARSAEEFAQREIDGLMRKRNFVGLRTKANLPIGDEWAQDIEKSSALLANVVEYGAENLEIYDCLKQAKEYVEALSIKADSTASGLSAESKIARNLARLESLSTISLARAKSGVETNPDLVRDAKTERDSIRTTLKEEYYPEIKAKAWDLARSRFPYITTELYKAKTSQAKTKEGELLLPESQPSLGAQISKILADIEKLPAQMENLGQLTKAKQGKDEIQRILDENPQQSSPRSAYMQKLYGGKDIDYNSNHRSKAISEIYETTKAKVAAATAGGEPIPHYGVVPESLIGSPEAEVGSALQSLFVKDLSAKTNFKNGYPVDENLLTDAKVIAEKVEANLVQVHNQRLGQFVEEVQTTFDDISNEVKEFNSEIKPEKNPNPQTIEEKIADKLADINIRLVASKSTLESATGNISRAMKPAWLSRSRELAQEIRALMQGEEPGTETNGSKKVHRAKAAN